MSILDDLPEDLARQLMSFLTESDGELQIADMPGLITFIARHSDRYPPLLSLINVNGDAVIQHFEETGEVPPGIKLIGTSTEEGSNVTHVQILQGPIPPRK